MLRCRLRYDILRKEAWPSSGLIHMVDKPRQDPWKIFRGGIGSPVDRSYVSGDAAGIWRCVEAALAECHRESIKGFGLAARGQDGNYG